MNNLFSFIILIFATFIAWEIVRYITPVMINGRLAPLIVVAIGYGWTWYDHRPSFIMAFAAAAGVAILHRITGAEGMSPIQLPNVTKVLRMRKGRRAPERRDPPSQVGNRIPFL